MKPQINTKKISVLPKCNRISELLMSTLNFQHIDFLLPNFLVRKALTPETSASLNSEV